MSARTPATRTCTRCPDTARARCRDRRHHCAACNGIGIVPDATRGYAACTCGRPAAEQQKAGAA